jgi:hypothetical protein
MEQVDIPEPLLAQALFNDNGDGSGDLIADMARSRRSDHRVVPAIAPIDQEMSPPPSYGEIQAAIDGWCGPEFNPVDGSPSVSTLPKQAIAARRLGTRVIFRQKKGKATNLSRKPVRAVKRRPINPTRAARARAVHSHACHGGSRKAADDSDGEPPRRRRKPKPKRKRFGPKQIETGWTRFNQFPSHMGRKIAPGECNYASSAALLVAVIGPKHDQQSGSVRAVKSVSSRKITTVVLRECVETHARIPISFYKFKRVSVALDGAAARVAAP